MPIKQTKVSGKKAAKPYYNTPKDPGVLKAQSSKAKMDSSVTKFSEQMQKSKGAGVLKAQSAKAKMDSLVTNFSKQTQMQKLKADKQKSRIDSQIRQKADPSSAIEMKKKYDQKLIEDFKKRSQKPAKITPKPKY